MTHEEIGSTIDENVVSVAGDVLEVAVETGVAEIILEVALDAIGNTLSALSDS